MEVSAQARPGDPAAMGMAQHGPARCRWDEPAESWALWGGQRAEGSSWVPAC